MKKLVLLVFVSLLIFESGCHSFRKKFIRKKRIQKDLPVYVDFKDYPTKPSRDAYIDYYLFVKGWLDELIGALRRGSSYKRQKRSLNEAIMNLEQIISFYSREGKDEVYPLYEKLLKIRESVNKAPNMSEIQRNNTTRKIEQLKRSFERDFNYSDAEKWMN